jgi:hypothetical protein
MSDTPFWRGSLELHYADFWLVDGISDVLIWGYAENGVGMIVGCVATLRPLFRRVFNLGGDSVPERTLKDPPTWPISSVRYRRREEEWVALHEPNDAKAKGSSIQLRETVLKSPRLSCRVLPTQEKRNIGPAKTNYVHRYCSNAAGLSHGPSSTPMMC